MSNSNPEHQTTTFRMRYRGNTLDGYVFTDLDHARQWLMQPIIDRSKIQIEPVEVGEPRQCRMCSGTGYHQTIKVVGQKVSAFQFLESTQHGKP